MEDVFNRESQAEARIPSLKQYLSLSTVMRCKVMQGFRQGSCLYSRDLLLIEHAQIWGSVGVSREIPADTSELT